MPASELGDNVAPVEHPKGNLEFSFRFGSIGAAPDIFEPDESFLVSFRLSPAC